MWSEKVVGDQGPTLREELARALKQERARLHAAVGALVGAGEQLAASQADEGRAGSADADVASDLAEAELDLGLERAELARLAEVEDALDRLETGGFGTCARCQHPIDVDRMRSLPWTRLCRGCADSATRWLSPVPMKGTSMTMITSCKDRLEQYLREHSVAYEVQHHPLAYTAQEVAASEHLPGRELAKTVIAITDDRSVMLVLPATRNVQVSKLATALGASQARLAEEGEFQSTFADCEVGAMPPFGNLYGMDVYVDRTLSEDERIVFRAGTHTDTMRIKYADFARLVKPMVVDIAHY